MTILLLLLHTRRFLGGGGVNSSTDSGEANTVVDSSDFVVILAALLCALVCVLGLFAMARCAWIRLISGGRSAAQPPSPGAANIGLKKKVLRSLPKLTYSNNSEDDEEEEEESSSSTDCPICLTGFKAGEEIRVLPQCGHGFHVLCIDTWLGSHSSCPSCRQIPVVVASASGRCQKCGDMPGEARLTTTQHRE